MAASSSWLFDGHKPRVHLDPALLLVSKNLYEFLVQWWIFRRCLRFLDDGAPAVLGSTIIAMARKFVSQQLTPTRLDPPQTHVVAGVAAAPKRPTA